MERQTALTGSKEELRPQALEAIKRYQDTDKDKILFAAVTPTFLSIMELDADEMMDIGIDTLEEVDRLPFFVWVEEVEESVQRTHIMTAGANEVEARAINILIRGALREAGHAAGYDEATAPMEA